MKRIIKNCLFIFIFFLFFWVVVFFMVKSRIENSETRRQEFNQVLLETGYQFKGRVLDVQEQDKGGGFLCLEIIEFNIQSGRKLVFDDQIRSMINKNGKIVQFGQRVFNYNNETLQVNAGDIINYNLDNSLIYQVVRNEKIIYEGKANVHSSKLQKDFLKYANGPCNVTE